MTFDDNKFSEICAFLPNLYDFIVFIPVKAKFSISTDIHNTLEYWNALH